jgi:hypothetical protein
LKTAAALLLLLLGPVGCSLVAQRVGAQTHWSQARWAASGLAPDPAEAPEAIVQVYAARTWGWKAAFAVHSWIVVKEEGAAEYERFEVVGWGVSRGLPAVRRNIRPADGYWAGNRPEIVAERRGPEAAALIPGIRAAVASYPWPDRYLTWPGPNSNTFVAHVLRQVPELGAELPPTAIGKDYLSSGIVGPTPSGTGYQLSLLGLLGIGVAAEEGLEVNLLGLVVGIDPAELAIKLPGIGTLGLRTRPSGAAPSPDERGTAGS